MSQTRFDKIYAALKLIVAKPAAYRLGRQQARCAPISPPNREDLVPYSGKNLKYLMTLWGETQRRPQCGLRYRHVYIWAVGLILAGWLMHGLSFANLGGSLMLTGVLTALWFCLKSRRHHKDSTMGR